MRAEQVMNIIEEHGQPIDSANSAKKAVVCQLIFKNGTQLSGALHYGHDWTDLPALFHMDAMIPTERGPKPSTVYFDVEDLSIIMVVPPAQDQGPRIVRLGD